MNSSSINGFLVGLTLSYIFYLSNEINELKRSKQPTISDRNKNEDTIQHANIPGFKQIGLLKNSDVNNNIILPLFARSTIPVSVYHSYISYDTNNWQFYTITHDTNLIIPLEIDKNDCMTDEGCRELHNNDLIFISVYNSQFKVKMYNVDMLHHEKIV